MPLIKINPLIKVFLCHWQTDFDNKLSDSFSQVIYTGRVDWL